MKVYFDNNSVPGQTYSHIDPAEMSALEALRTPPLSESVIAVTSRESTREQEKIKDAAVRTKLETARNELSFVENDHTVLGFANQGDANGGWICNPIVTDMVDESAFGEFGRIGLTISDAKHLMYAVHNRCDRFITLDEGVLRKATRLEPFCRGLRILRPSELVQELTAAS